MAEFMVEFDLPVPFSADFIAKIPEQREVINEFLEEGKVISFALAEDRSRMWLILQSANEFEAAEILNEFPLIEDMPYTITELMFNHAGVLQVPSFSLN